MHIFEKHKIKSTLTVLFLLNFCTGLYFINAGLFHYDSVVLAKAVESTYHTMKLEPAVDGRYGSVILVSIVHFPFFMLGQNADFSVRFTSILFHTLSILMLFLFVYALFKSYMQALFSALFLSFTPFYFSVNTYGKEHSMALFFLLFSFYLIYCGTKNNNAVEAGIGSLLFGFAMTIRETILALAPLFFLLYFAPQASFKPFRLNVSKDRFSPKLLLAGFLPFTAVVLTAFLVYLHKPIYRMLFIKDNNFVYFLGLLSPAFGFAIRDLYISVPWVIFIFFIAGIIRMFYEKVKFLPLFFLVWFLMIFYFANNANYAARHLTEVMIPVYVFSSFALVWAAKKNKWAAGIIVVYCVLSMFMVSYPMLKVRRHYSGPKEFAEYVRICTEENAVIIALDEAPFIDYYGKRKVMGYTIDGDKAAMEKFIDGVNNYLDNKTPVYLTESALTYDHGGEIERRLWKDFKVTVVGEKLMEDFHRAEIGFRFYEEKVYKVEKSADRDT